MKRKQRVSHQLFHITDWLPTFAHLAGVSVAGPIDGQNIWQALSLELDSPRHEVLGHLDDSIGYSAYIKGPWKYVNGSTHGGQFDDWLNEVDDTETHSSFENYGKSVLQSEAGMALHPYSYSLQKGRKHRMSEMDANSIRALSMVSCNVESNDVHEECNPLQAPCLFDIIADPCERRNLAAIRRDVVSRMADAVDRFRHSAEPPRNRPSDRRSNPANFNNTWTWWYDELGLSDYDEISIKNVASLKLTNNGLLAVAFLAFYCLA